MDIDGQPAILPDANLGESLAGRVRILRLGTLSATELHQTKLLKNERDLLWKGGFPEVWAEKLNATDFFEDYIQTYIERDIRRIVNIHNMRDFRRFLSLVALRVGQLLNYSEISKEVGVAVNTIKAWINALEISGLIILLTPYYKNLGKRLIKAPKLYICDNGLAAALLNINSLKALENSLYLGALWENFVFTEFIKEGFVPGRNIFYLRDHNGAEIDFIIEKDGQTWLIEAKNTERPNPRKLNFHKISPLFEEETIPVVACGVENKGMATLKDFSVYNPLHGFLFSHNIK